MIGCLQPGYLALRGDNAGLRPCARRTYARPDQQWLLLCRLLFKVLYNIFMEQWYGISAPLRPGMAVVQGVLEQVTPKPPTGPTSAGHGRADEQLHPVHKSNAQGKTGLVTVL